MSNGNRPALISVVGYLGIISGLANVVLGILLVMARESASLAELTNHTAQELMIMGIASVIGGAIYFFAAYSLLRGSKVARVFYAVIASLNVALGIYGAFALTGTYRLSAVFSSVMGAIMLMILFNHKSNDFFQD